MVSVVFMGFLYIVILNFYFLYIIEVKLVYVMLDIINFFCFFGEFLVLFVSYKLINCIGNINMIFFFFVLYMFNYFVCLFIISCW